MMHKLMAAIFAVLAIGGVLFAVTAQAGNCDHSWQTAADGSSCGDRSADSRPGGQPN